jgi:hypothetical protein
MFEFIWIEDIYRDGFPELYMVISHKYSFSNPALFVEMIKERVKLGAGVICKCSRIGPKYRRRMRNITLNRDKEY